MGVFLMEGNLTYYPKLSNKPIGNQFLSANIKRGLTAEGEPLFKTEKATGLGNLFYFINIQMAASLRHLGKDNIIIVQGTIFVTPDP